MFTFLTVIVKYRLKGQIIHIFNVEVVEVWTWRCANDPQFFRIDKLSRCYYWEILIKLFFILMRRMCPLNLYSSLLRYLENLAYSLSIEPFLSLYDINAWPESCRWMRFTVTLLYPCVIFVSEWLMTNYQCS